jgi:hypothetical protein
MPRSVDLVGERSPDHAVAGEALSTARDPLDADGSNVESYRRVEMRKLVDDLLLFSCIAAFAVGIVVTIASLLS